MRRIVCLMILWLFTFPAVAQVFKGRVTNEQGETVPYATLYIKDLKWGFTADDNGRFLASLKSGTYTCEISSLGYGSQSIILQIPSEGLEKNIVLKERVYALREVSVVKGAEDPAYAVMRKAISRAPYYRTQVKGFKAGIYLKGTGKGISIPAILKISKEVREDSKKFLGKLFLLEEQREVTFKSPDVWENHVKAYNNTFPEELSVSIGLTTINLYQPTIFDKVSPLSAGAFSYYRFKLEGCYSEGNYLVNKIRIIPKKENPRLISGTLYIIEDLWCVSAVDLKVSTGGLKATVKITCKEVLPSVFMPASTSMACNIDLMGFKAEASYLAAVHYVNVQVADGFTANSKEGEAANVTARSLSKKQQKLKRQIETLSSKDDLTMNEAYKLSRLVEKSLEESDTLRSGHKFERRSYNNRKNVKTDSLAGKKDSLYWAAVRSVPLKPEEIQSYVEKEKLSLQKDSLTTDTVRKASTVGGKIAELLLVGNTFKTKNKKAWLCLYGLPSYFPEYNFVDGFWLGARLEAGIRLSDVSAIRFEPSLYYVTARKTVVGEGRLTLDYIPRRRGKLFLSGGLLSADYNGDSGESRLINAVASSLFGRNDVKLYEKRYIKLGHQVELANSLLLSASVDWQQRRSLDNHISRSWFKRQAEPNIPVNEYFRKMPENDLLKVSVGLDYTPAHYYRMIRGEKLYEESKFPTFSVRYDKAFPVGDKEVKPSYQSAEFSVRHKIEFGLFNRLVWSAHAGMFWDTRQMEFPDFKHFATTHIPVTERTFDSGFSLLDNYALSTDSRWAQGNISWYTPYLLVKHLPFLRKKNFDEAVHLRSIIVYDRRSYSEIGYSIGVSFMARVGVFLGFDGLKYRSAGVSVSIPLSIFKDGEISL